MMTATETAQYLRRYHAHNVIGVLNVLHYSAGAYRGKVNLGLAVCGPRRNNWLARPVDNARKLGLVTETQDGAALCYTLNDKGEAVRNALQVS